MHSLREDEKVTQIATLRYFGKIFMRFTGNLTA